MEITLENLANEISTRSNPLLLLASPFIYTFVHETIHLSSSELEQADLQKLSVSKAKKENRFITSIHVSDKKAITIHSHLTTKGLELLVSFKDSKKRIPWRPAIENIIINLLNHPPETEIQQGGDRFRMLLDYEYLQADWSLTFPIIQHFNCWNPSLSYNSKIKHLNQITTNPTNNRTSKIWTIADYQNDDKLQIIMRNLLFPKRKKQKYKIIFRKPRKNRQLNLKFITLNRVLVTSTIILFLWAVFSNLVLTGLKADRLSLQQSINALQAESKKLSKIAQTERLYFKANSMLEAAGSLRINPHSFLNKLDRILPGSVWIKNLSISHQKIDLELLDHEETELTSLMSTLGEQNYHINLNKNETIQINGRSLKHYQLVITTPHSTGSK